jgi:hypothetical protein
LQGPELLRFSGAARREETNRVNSCLNVHLGPNNNLRTETISRAVAPPSKASAHEL